jgi:hypothetical protein
MLEFKEIKTSQEAVSVYNSICSEVAEFKQTKDNEELARSYNFAQQEIIDELSDKIKHLENQIDIRDKVIVELKTIIFKNKN